MAKASDRPVRDNLRRALAATALLLLMAAPASARPVVVCDDVTPPPSLDPRQVFSDKGHSILQQIFDGLVFFTPNGDIEPALAVSWERIDPLTMRFHLRPGVRFHNGEPLEAESVRSTLEQMLDPRTNFPGAGFVNTIDHAVVVDTATVDIVTRMPDSLLLRRLAAFVFLLPPQAGRSPGFGLHPVGTGPYRFESMDENDGIRLTRNLDYWRMRASAPDSLQFRFIPTQKQLEMLLAGEVDLLADLPGTVTLRVASNPNTKVVKRATFYTVAMTFNTTRGPLQDVRVRRAMNYAINKEELIRYDLVGNGRTIASLSMPGEVGHDPGLRPYAFDLVKARRLLKESGVAVPFRLRVLTKAQGDRTARIIAKQLKAVGIDIEIKGVTTDADAIRDLASPDMDIGLAALPDVMGHSAFLQSIYLYSKSPFSLHKDPDYDRRLEAVVAELEPLRHERMARELDRHVYDQALSLFTYQRIRTYGVSRRLDFVPNVTGRLYLDRADVAQDNRRQQGLPASPP